MRRTYWQALAVGILLTVPVWAQEEDGPGRGIARLSLTNGDVSVRRGDSGDWVAAAPNAPLVAQDHVLTGANSRAEVQFDWANMLRLASDTDVRMAELENRRYQAQLARGTTTLRVLRDSDAEIEVDTPNASVRPTKKGIYRIEVLENGETEVTVRSGEVEIYTPRGVEKLKSGRTMLIRGTQADPEFQVLDARNRDDWDRWNDERDRRLERSNAYAYVSRDIYGADDLDEYGSWTYIPGYGRCWRPSYYDAGWAPYRYGRWAWVDYYGWTWVSYDPWGWAPYHYGRWFYDRPYGWCWYPGPAHYRHYWRPALVAFFGFNAGPVSVGFGFGRVGWVPLAPYETYHPWYGPHLYRGYRNGAYVDNSVRIVNNVNITNVYRNSRVVNGMSGMDYNDFGRGGRARAFTNEEIRINKASMVQGALPIAPRQESLRLTDREAHVPVQRGNVPERFYARRQPAQVERVSFADQQRGMEHLARRTFGDQTGKAEAAGATGWRGGDQRREAGAPGRTNDQGGNAGWRRMGDAGNPAGARTERSGAMAGEQTGGWRGGNQPARQENANEGWRGFGGRTASQEAVKTEGERPAAGRVEGNQAGWRTRTEDAGRIRNENRTETARPESGGAWQRFGGRRETGAAAESARPDGWRGGSAGAERSQPERSQPRFQEFPKSEPRPESTRPDAGWRGGNAGAERSQPERPQQRFQEFPRSEPRSETPQSSPRFSRPDTADRGSWSRPERSEPVRINPPIVRERSSGGGGAPAWHGNSGGGAARTEGGGGGGWRGNSGGGGGGGGQRSGGGGGQHSGGGGGRGGRDR